MPECTTAALHCVACGRPSNLMQGALTDCCGARVTRATTCNGAHPTYEMGPGAGPEAIDQVLVPHLLQLAQSLGVAGRTAEQAIADLHRGVDALEAGLIAAGEIVPVPAEADPA